MFDKRKLKKIQKYCLHASVNLEHASNADEPYFIWIILSDLHETLGEYQEAARKLAKSQKNDGTAE